MDFSYYQAQLEGKDLPPAVDQPQAGYYGKRDRNGVLEPVTIYDSPKEGQKMAKVGRSLFVPATDIWNSVAGHAIPQADVEYWYKHGQWPGDVEVVDLRNSRDLGLFEELDDYMETCRTWSSGVNMKEVNKTVADMAANYGTQLAALTKKLDDERKAKIAPHLDAQRGYNADYNPKIDEGRALVKALKGITGVYLKAQEELAKAAGADVDVIRPRAGGQRGRRVGLRTVETHELQDAEAMYAWVEANRKADLIKAAFDIAKQAVRDGVDVPGVKTTKTKEAV
jgi:hypothetical protein